jgi:hypothetical protein
MMLDLNTLLFGTLLGLALGGAIVVFLIYAAINAAKENTERAHFNGFASSGLWSHVSRSEPQRNHLHTLGRDLDTFEW